MRVGSHGLRVTPVRGEMPVPFQPNSGVVVRPMTTVPASSSRPTIGDDAAAGVSGLVRDPFPAGSPSSSMLSFTAIGTPCRTLRTVPARTSASRSTAAARARSGSNVA